MNRRRQKCRRDCVHIPKKKIHKTKFVVHKKRKKIYRIHYPVLGQHVGFVESCASKTSRNFEIKLLAREYKCEKQKWKEEIKEQFCERGGSSRIKCPVGSFSWKE